MANFNDLQDLPSYIRLCDQDDAEVLRIQQKVSRLMKWNRPGFSGSVPVSLNKQNVNLLLTENYRVLAKLDGVRFLFFVEDKDAHYMINRNNQVFQVFGISAFPNVQVPQVSRTSSEYLQDTVFDVELMKVETEETAERYELYVFDFIVLNGEYVGDRGLEERMRIFKLSIGHVLKSKARDDSITFRINPQFPLSEANALWKRKQAMNGSLELDGLIFVDINKAYNYYPRIPGANESSLRWKPQDVNTVDFKLEIAESPIRSPALSTGNLVLKGTEEPFGTIELTPELQALNSKVIECNFDKAKGSWSFYRERWDKHVPNLIETAENIMSSIEDGMDETQLFDFIQRHFGSGESI